MVNRRSASLSLVGAATLLIVATEGVQGAAALGSTSGASASVDTRVAPYMDLSGPNPGNLAGAIDAGLTDVTAAFVVGRGCTPIWDDGSPVAKDKRKSKAIREAQVAGADVIISFGGAGGKELARSCTDQGELTDAYRAVIDRFGVTQVDFDVEGASIDPVEQKGSIARRFAAIRTLQQRMPGLEVSVTIAVGRGGLVPSGIHFLRVAKQTGTRIDLVNIMTMDYGGSVGDMGGTAIKGAEGTLAQVRSLWPDYTYANLGITPMIGDNDSPGETFGLDDAAEVRAFAAAHQVGRLAFWSVNRDQPCTRGTARARGGCSGVEQDPMEFTKTFLGG
jgi:hypothetical protein